MSTHDDLVARYIDAWNETDDGARRDLIARTWTEDARYVDPLMEGEGHAGIDALIRGAQEKFPGLRFSLAGNVETHHDRLRFSWALARSGARRWPRAPISPR